MLYRITESGLTMDKKGMQVLLEQGFFSELDIHFARLIVRLSDKEDEDVFLAASLVSRATGEGHVCLDLSTVEGRPLITDESGTEDVVSPTLEVWRKKLDSSNVVGRPGDDRPLILDDRSRLYLYRYWDYENILANKISERVVSKIEAVDLPLLKDGLSKFFSPLENGQTDWQKLAAFVCVLKKFCVVSGGPGTGKSTLIARIIALILEQRKGSEMRIAIAAPTGKAAARLQEAIQNGKERLPIEAQIKEAIPIEASTLHRLMGTIPGSPYFRHNGENPLPVDMVIVDEASMVDLALMSKLVQALPSDARLVLLGDKDQLASVEAGAVLGDICDTGRIHGFSKNFSTRFREITGASVDISPKNDNEPGIQDCVVDLQKNYRFGLESGIRAASLVVNQGDGNLALRILKSGEYDDIKWTTLPEPNAVYSVLRENVLNGFKPYLETADPLEIFSLFGQFRILCALRKGPYGVSAQNLLVEQVLRDENLIDTDKRWYRGRPVMITTNDYNIGLFNGDIGIIMPDPATNHDLRAFFLSPDGALRSFLPVRLPEHETVYAMTVHKSQGSEFDKALLILPDRHTPVLTRELIYTGITRAKKNIEVWGTERIFIEGVSQRIERSSGLRDALWEV
jgi:exodeoxyribonuclease V alpha subunit